MRKNNVALKSSNNNNSFDSNKRKRIQCGECEGYGHIKSEYANTFKDAQSDGSKEEHIIDDKVNSYDYIVTLFFIDTSPSILNTLTQIYTLLKPGGMWIKAQVNHP